MIKKYCDNEKILLWLKKIVKSIVNENKNENRNENGNIQFYTLRVV